MQPRPVTLLLSHSSIALVVAVSLAACASGPVTPAPPEIRYGADTCDQCGMIISDPAYAAALQLTNGEYREFDDIGDLFAYQSEHTDEEVLAAFVHDHDSLEWIRAEDAFFVRGVNLITPMGSGYAAFASQSSAGTFAAERGPTLVQRYADLQAHYMLHGDMHRSHTP
jgi:copper chaperone NosL